MKMNIVKCKICREPFNSYGGQVCPVCLEQLDKDFFTVRDYIYDHPREASVDQIAEATGIKEKHIVYLLEEGRLSVKGDIAGVNLGGGLKCQVCGRGINSGTLCESCKGALTKELDSAAASLDVNKNSGGSYVSPRSSKYQSEHNKLR